MLMHLEYKLGLPDHTWVIASRHKLIPSVYAAIEIEADAFGKPGAVKYSGPLYIAIRSGKHSSSTPESHAFDLQQLLKHENFTSQVQTLDGMIKPVLILTVDGGPDENPRYQRVICCAVDHFRKFNLDAVFIATNAPGRSAYNRVERFMSPLSRHLSGVILPHDFYGTHLDSNSKTIDKDLEEKNVCDAGKILADIWDAELITGRYKICHVCVSID